LGIPGIGEEIDKAMQQAPQSGRHSIEKLKVTPSTLSFTQLNTNIRNKIEQRINTYSDRFFVFLHQTNQMRIDIITVLPELLESPLNHSIVKRAKEKKLVEINIINLRDFTTDKYKSVDDYAFGGGAGMVMMIEPVYKAIGKLKRERDYDEIIYTSPDGEKLNQKIANSLSLKENIIILAGHYKGVDQRIRDHLITMEISIGDFVISGGELPAAIITDAIVRLIPGAISDEQSALSDSFQDDLLAPPVYTRPADFNGWQVPAILLSGHIAEIEKWRHEQSLERTRLLRPDLNNDE
jgi:tRNA (guanine37-N1)-methyltransferase